MSNDNDKPTTDNCSNARHRYRCAVIYEKGLLHIIILRDVIVLNCTNYELENNWCDLISSQHPATLAENFWSTSMSSMEGAIVCIA